MKYKKISLTPKNGLITQLESDTILGYIFGYNYEKLSSILKKYISGNPPFLISNGFGENSLPKPMFFQRFSNSPSSTLQEDLNQEVKRKAKKKLETFPLKKELFFELFEGNDQDKYNTLVDLYLGEKESSKLRYESHSQFKASIPRFNVGDTNPYEVEDIQYTNGNYIIYVKIYNNEDFELFFQALKSTFESIGFGKGKSRGYGHFSKIECKDLDPHERDVFDYIEGLKKNHLYYVLNSFKPKVGEIEHIDLQKSFYQIHAKHTKSLSEFNLEIFKGPMNFFAPGSVLYSENPLAGDFYKSGNAYNFGYIF